MIHISIFPLCVFPSGIQFFEHLLYWCLERMVILWFLHEEEVNFWGI